MLEYTCVAACVYWNAEVRRLCIIHAHMYDGFSGQAGRLGRRHKIDLDLHCPLFFTAGPLDARQPTMDANCNCISTVHLASRTFVAVDAR